MRHIISILIVLLLLAGCGKKMEKTEAVKAPSQEELLQEASATLINDFGKTLKSELMAALNAGGPENAISVCQVKAPEIAATKSSAFWTIKRVTDKNRNSENLANEHQLAIMAKFADTTKPAPDFIEEWLDVDSVKTYCFYKPIMTGQLCLTCHGDPANMDDKVKMALKKTYPNDKAIGYKTDQLRGMFVVEVKWPEGEAFLSTIASDSI